MKMSIILTLQVLPLSVMLLFASVILGTGSGVLIDSFFTIFQKTSPASIAPVNTHYVTV
jgi:hypothetical protein